MGVIEICIKYLKLIELQCYVLFLSAFDVEINAKNERKGVSRMWENAYMNTRMQSSRMHTIYYSSCLKGGVSGWGVSTQGVGVSQHAQRQTSPLWTEFLTNNCENITFLGP